MVQYLNIRKFGLARKVRLFFRDTPQHIVIRGINDKVIFREEEDYYAFLEMLKILVENMNIEIHAYVLMPTYFQFLATPSQADALSKFMQSLGRRYVGYFNKKYERKGTLWEGRYKSSLIQADRYLYEVMKFIETRPKNYKAYLYSSIHKNCFSQDDAVITLHKIYQHSQYVDVLNKDYDETVNAYIASSLEKQTVTGSTVFLKQIEEEIGKRLTSLRRGRPKKSIRKKMYSNLVLINKEKHKNLKLLAMENFSFANSLKFIPIVVSEAPVIGKDYPIVITAGKNPSLGVVVALDGDNLSINREGKWYGAYVPAYLRKYPFSLGVSSDNPKSSLMLIDMDSSLLSEEEGEALFDEEGKQSRLFQEKIELVSLYERDRKNSEKIIKIIIDANILESGEIVVGKGEEKKVLVKGFQAVSRAKLDALSEDIKKDWDALGVTNFIELHLKSLDKISNLFKLASQQQE